MCLSFGSVFICVSIIFFLYIYFEFLLKANSQMFIGEIRYIFIGVIFLCLRALIPFNFPFTVTIPIQYGLTQISDFLTLTNIRGYSIFECFLCLWVIGFFIKIFLFIKKTYEFGMIIHQAVNVEHVRKKRISDILGEYINTKMDIAILPNFYSPSLTGFFRPVLIMPDYDFSTEELHYIISHEVIHLKKHDLYLKFFLDICKCIYWWNPVMHLFVAKFFLAIEIANDITVIKNKPSDYQLSYIKCLMLNCKLQCEEKSQIHRDDFEIPFIKGSMDLKIRVQKILNHTNIQSLHIWTYFCRFVLISIVLLGIVVVPEAYYISNDVQNSTFSIDGANSYLVKKLNSYDLYVNDMYIATIYDVDETLKSLQIYQEEEE